MKCTACGFVIPLLVVALSGCGEEPARDFREVLQEVRVCAAGPTVDGIDVSYWQGTINWDQVAAAGIRFAIIRTGDGYFEDPQFERNWSERAGSACIVEPITISAPTNPPRTRPTSWSASSEALAQGTCRR